MKYSHRVCVFLRRKLNKFAAKKRLCSKVSFEASKILNSVFVFLVRKLNKITAQKLCSKVTSEASNCPKTFVKLKTQNFDLH